MSSIKVLELTYKLQSELEAMNESEFKEFMKGKAIRYNGKLHVLENENEQGKKRQVKRETTRNLKGSDRDTKSL